MRTMFKLLFFPFVLILLGFNALIEGTTLVYEIKNYFDNHD